ncbi:putative 6-hydroxy-D-nicotine oxidase [Rosellinia necatrix]|uniref:Putative 6-hydroxy-D-nicotine oxidase n=1 Tax=Rosellinia necatrix TaxID=77044 RepID=A0A1W2TJP9_ROSNE|nr:putative 6-hydroxy-D-nicotine oxidase [Rosellinia necatrix]
MSTTLRFLGFGLAVFSAVVSGSPIAPEISVPRYFQRSPSTPAVISLDQVQNDLGRLMSNSSLIFGPSSDAYSEATDRWNTYSKPDIQVVVEVGQESDIAQVVKYCNQNSIDFLAYSRGHGMSTTVARMKGIEINLSKLTNITIRPDKKTALLQGGAYADLILGALGEIGYTAVLGANGCVGFGGLSLGGGLGRLQGQHGLVSDNVVSMNVVLANGTTIKVSDKSNSDLFWAMKGAGHNFGIVTSFEIKIYPQRSATWHYHNYLWRQDKLEDVFKALNKLQGMGKLPARMGASLGQISINSSISSTEPVIFWTFAYDGPAKEAEKLLADFNKIKAVVNEQGDVEYPQLLVAQETDSASASCASLPYIGASANLQTYNVTTQRQLYNHFTKRLVTEPEIGANARLYYEGFSSLGSQAINAASSAFPHRDEYLPVYFITPVPEGKEDAARKWAHESRDLWNQGQPLRRPTTYVNFAAGDETVEALYGHEPWRLQRLRSLKAKYDPQNRFRWFNPIIRD